MRRACTRSIALLAVSGLLFAPGLAAGAQPISLAQAISRALAVAPAYAAALAGSDLAAAKVGQAQAPFYPYLSAVGDYTQAPGYDERVSNGGLTAGQLVANYTVYDGGRRFAKLQAARYAALAAQFGTRAAKAQVVFNTTVAYYALLRAQQVQAEHARSLTRLDDYTRIVENLRRSGRAIASDVLRVRTARDQEHLALEAARQARQSASITLGALLGLFDRPDLQIAAVAGLPRLPSGKISESPALLAARRAVQAAEASENAARAARLPILSLGLTAGWEGVNPPQTFNHNLGASYGAQISVPIFEGGLITSQIEQAQATHAAALAALRAVEYKLKAGLANARAAYYGARRQLAAASSAQTTAEDEFALDWTRFLGGGNVTLLEVLTGYQAAEQFRLTRMNQEFAARQAAAQARLVLGVDS